MSLRRLGLIAALAIAAPAGAGSAPLRCADPLVTVDAASLPVARRVCAAIAAAKPRLAACGLSQSRPVTVEVVREIEGAADHCAGLYQCGTDRIALVTPDRVTTVMPEGSVFAGLDPEVYYDSLVVHEFSHALMDQADCERPRCTADREYVAYAFQIDSLPEEGRETIRAWRDMPEEIPRERLNDFLALMKPDIFAATAWAHFDALDDPCGFVGALATGRTTLALPPLVD